jgi:hypothetical protein
MIQYTDLVLYKLVLTLTGIWYHAKEVLLLLLRMIILYGFGEIIEAGSWEQMIEYIEVVLYKLFVKRMIGNMSLVVIRTWVQLKQMAVFGCGAIQVMAN